MAGSKTRHSNLKANALLEVALRLFSAKGYSDVSMQEIARESNTTYSLAYYYFKNKEDLFHAAVTYSIDQTIENYNQIRKKHSSPVALIEDWLESNIAHSESLKRVVKVMLEFSDKRIGSPSVDKNIKQLYQFEKSLLSESIQLGVESGIFTCSDPDSFAEFISNHIDGIFYGALVRPEMQIEQSMNHLKAVVWRLLDYTPEHAPR